MILACQVAAEIWNLAAAAAAAAYLEAMLPLFSPMRTPPTTYMRESDRRRTAAAKR